MTYDGAKLRGYIDGELIVENDVTGIAVNDTTAASPVRELFQRNLHRTSG